MQKTASRTILISNLMNSNLSNTFKQEADALFPQLVAWRRDLHKHPELAFQEVRTAGVVADHLNNLGLEVSTGVGKTGVVAMVEGDNLPEDAPTLMLRFDMDALPILEETTHDFPSEHPGVMHACGHDGHTAIGMGVAKLLSQHRSALPGRVKLVFQPGEEGAGGALAMINDGALTNPKPAAAFGLHLMSRLPLNTVVVQPGELMAGADKIALTVIGKGGHGAMPHETVDAIVVASHIVVAWQSIVARNVHPIESAVVTVGVFNAGGAGNIIAEQATLLGSMRWFKREVRDLVIKRLEETANGICAAFGATCNFELTTGVGSVVNSEEGAEIVRQAACAVVPSEDVIEIPAEMVSEDMSEFLNRAPGCFFFVGAQDPAQSLNAPHHNPRFDWDERMMPTGVAIMANATVEYLQRHTGK